MRGIAGIHYKHDVDGVVLDRAAAHFSGSAGLVCQHRGARAVHAGSSALADTGATAGAQARRGLVFDGDANAAHAMAGVLAQGEAALGGLNAGFALCLWNESEESLLLARDRFGIARLFVYEDEHCIAFASQLRTLLGLAGLDHTLDEVGFQDFLSYGHALAPRTLFARIRRLDAGGVLRHAQGRSDPGHFASLELHEAAATAGVQEYVAELDSLMLSSVQARLAPGEPVGVLLDGGLGSALVAECALRAGARLTGYSLGAPGASERTLPREVASRLGLEHVEISSSAADLLAGLDALLPSLDEPLCDASAVAMAGLAHHARQSVTSLLCAQGCDEVLGGRALYQLALVPALDRDTRFAHFFFKGGHHIDANEWLRDKSLPPHHVRLRTHFDHADTPLNGMQSLDLHSRLPEHLLARSAAALGLHGVQGRFPFLDLEVWRFASALPQALKLAYVGGQAPLLHQMAALRLPGLQAPPAAAQAWPPLAELLPLLRGRLLDALEALRGQPVAQVLDLDAVAASLQRFHDGDGGVSASRAWSLAALLLWWAQVYPALRAAPPADTARRRLVIYTALVGSKEPLANPLAELPAGSCTDLELDWVCITDNPELRSPVWRMQLMPAGHVPPEKLSRRPKALPHEYFPDAEFSLYVDNTVSFKRLPQSSDLLTQRPYLFRAFRHSTRTSPSQEAAAVATIGYDDVGVICQQIDFYAQHRPLSSITPLTTATVLLRQHHHPAIKRFGVTWWETLLTFSKRDQISFDFSLQEADAQVEYFEGLSSDNTLIHWNGSLSPQRVRADFDAKRYAWIHRDDPQAQRNPKGHFLARGGGSQEAYLRDLSLLEFSCHMNGSSLGRQVSPRRDVADVLEALLGEQRTAGTRYLAVRVADGGDACAFDREELDTAGRALATFLNPAAGTVMDMADRDLSLDGKVYALPEGARYGLLILLGAGGEQLGMAVDKLYRLLDTRRGQFVAVLSSPTTLATAAAVEGSLASHLGKPVQASLHASRHDSMRGLRANTVACFKWQPSPAEQPA